VKDTILKKIYYMFKRKKYVALIVSFLIIIPIIMFLILFSSNELSEDIPKREIPKDFKISAKEISSAEQIELLNLLNYSGNTLTVKQGEQYELTLSNNIETDIKVKIYCGIFENGY